MKRIKQSMTWASLTFCWLCFSCANAAACSCVSLSPCESFGHSKAVFIGRMLSGSEKLREYTSKSGDIVPVEAGLSRFAVEEAFKGVQGNEIEIFIHSMKGTSCGDYGLTPGKTYLVFAHESSGQLAIGPCGSTAEVHSNYIKAHLDFLRNLPKAGTGGRIYGSVKLDDGSSSPLPNIKIAIRDERGRRFEVKTNHDGDFEVNGVLPGKYQVEPVWAEYYTAHQPKREIEVTDRGCVEVSYWTKINGRLNGKVVDVNQRPASVTLNLVSSDDPEKGGKEYGFSDAKDGGKFEIDEISPGTYLLFLEVKSAKSTGKDEVKRYFYPGVYERDQAHVIPVGLGQQLSGIEFELPPEFSVQFVKGRIEWPDGAPAADIDVLLQEEKDSPVKGLGIYGWGERTITDEHGNFTLQGFKAVAYRIEARTRIEKAISGKQEASHAAPFNLILNDDVTEVVLVLSKPGLSEEKATPSKEKKK